MKKILILSILILSGMLSIAQTTPQPVKQPDSIQVVQFTVTPQALRIATQMIQDKYLKSREVTDTVNLQNVFGMLFSDYKQIKIKKPNGKN